ncbi:extracellular solute-binding protein [Mesorhizobium sp. M2A.F.Ca.ET.039.01.1.1]|uniref:extracellular solute-binding protein n=1 Tax=Mesorhizobium sp. M2A.F.Ca.ET.039.01.1.1 TaxID=2496746 RepID=UPI000FC9FF5B|nr:extracellular solute-binding protein [Mesorhizobium sp. M2A.F.Ca.ET.039.01.1.1]RWX70669.1 extracellular solute-binding protein [Mesorhizobium sp. M2A.F.Ca.ET.039.01.1.1]TIV47152.1 MAG: extracellular solute-binding protein [Mesorhizobium sp.]
MMKKAIGLTGLLVLAALTTSARAEEVLRLYAWDGLFDSWITDGFTAKTGIKVVYDSYDSDESLETKLLSGDSGYDFVVPSATPFLAREIAAGALEPLNKDWVPRYAAQIPELMALLKRSDPTLGYAAVGGWGTLGMGLNVGKVHERLPDAPIDSYDLIFKPENVAKLADCGVSIADSATEVVPIVLNYLGLDPQSKDPADLDKAMALLQSIRPYVQLSKGKLPTEMAAGDVCIAIGYSGEVIQAKNAAKAAANGQDIQYILPKEGTLAWITSLAIPKGAPNPKAGHAFMDFLLTPQVGAHMTEVSGYGNGVPGSRALLPKELAEDKTIFPEGAVMAKLFVSGTVKDTLTRQRNRAWTKFQSGE